MPRQIRKLREAKFEDAGRVRQVTDSLLTLQKLGYREQMICELLLEKFPSVGASGVAGERALELSLTLAYRDGIMRCIDYLFDEGDSDDE